MKLDFYILGQLYALEGQCVNMCIKDWYNSNRWEDIYSQYYQSFKHPKEQVSNTCCGLLRQMVSECYKKYVTYHDMLRNNQQTKYEDPFFDFLKYILPEISLQFKEISSNLPIEQEIQTCFSYWEELFNYYLSGGNSGQVYNSENGEFYSSEMFQSHLKSYLLPILCKLYYTVKIYNTSDRNKQNSIQGRLTEICNSIEQIP